jgi:hypothetical protein
VLARLAQLAGGLNPSDRRLITAPIRSRSLGTVIAGGAARGIGFSHSLLGAALADEQDAQRQKCNAHIKPQRGMANIPVVERALFFLGDSRNLSAALNLA